MIYEDVIIKLKLNFELYCMMICCEPSDLNKPHFSLSR